MAIERLIVVVRSRRRDGDLRRRRRLGVPHARGVAGAAQCAGREYHVRHSGRGHVASGLCRRIARVGAGRSPARSDRQTLSSVHVMGKGPRERVLPLWNETAAAVKAWLRVCPASADALGPRMHPRQACRHSLSRCSDDRRQERQSARPVAYLRDAHPAGKPRRAEGFALARHANLQSTEVYLRADPTEKLEAIAAMVPPMLKPGCFVRLTSCSPC